VPRIHPRPALTAVVSLAMGILLFNYGTGHLRGFGGDILVVLFMDACLAGIGLGTPRSRLVFVLLFSAGVEAFQGLGLVGPDSHWLLHLTLGSTFDPWDLLAYVIGTGVAAGAEWAWGWGRSGVDRQT